MAKGKVLKSRSKSVKKKPIKRKARRRKQKKSLPEQAKSGNLKKLTLDEQHQVCQWLAEFNKPAEVVTLCKDELDVEISRPAIIGYLKEPRWAKEVQKRRKHFLDHLDEIPIANKALRLKRLEKICEQGMTWYTSSYGQYGNVEKLELGTAISAIKQAQTEMEGNKLVLEGGDKPIEVVHYDDNHKPRAR